MDHEDGDGDGAGLDGGVDGDFGGGTEEPSVCDSGGVFPLQSVAPGLCFGVSVFRRRSLLANVGGLFYSCF